MGRRLCFVALTLLACRNPSGSQAQPQALAPAPTVDASADEGHVATPPDPTTLAVHGPEDLAGIDRAAVLSLDLAFSPTDRIEAERAGSPAESCPIDTLTPALRELVNLRRLKVSGCAEHLPQLLSAVSSEHLEAIELVEVTLDAKAIAALRAFGGVREVALTRVEVTSSLQPLYALRVAAIEFTDLSRDSDLDALLELWGRSLVDVTLRGSWAGHPAILRLTHATRLQRLELRDTRAGNFSLHQIKPLGSLREIVLSGSTFTDQTPLYLRELALQRFSCACSRISDVGVRHLRHMVGLRELALHSPRISGTGLGPLDALQQLETLHLDAITMSPEGFEALATLPKLRNLELSGAFTDPNLTGLGSLSALRSLRLVYPTLDARAAAEIGRLSALEALDLSGTAWSDQGLEALGNLSRLRMLKLHHTRVTRHGFAALGQLQGLEVLELDHTDVMDEAVIALGELASLHTLRLDSTLVTDRSMASIGRMRALERLNLSDTVVSEKGLAALANLEKLSVLTLDGTRAAAGSP